MLELQHASRAAAPPSYTRSFAGPAGARSSAASHQSAVGPASPQYAPFPAHNSIWQPRRQRLQVAAASDGAAHADLAGVSTLRGPIPTRLNTIPHERTTRRYFYQDATEAVQRAITAGETRITVNCTIPELNTNFDVYRVGTLLEMAREIVTDLAGDDLRVRVCVQQALGKGVFQGMPLSLNGVMRIMNMMDWGSVADRVSTGNLGAAEVEHADAFVLICPQNIVGHSIMPLLAEMVEAAEEAGKPLVLLNPKLTDIQSAGGVMGVRGRQERIDFAATFGTAYHFRLLYKGAEMHPIMGALRYSYGGPWEVFRRFDLGLGQEEYRRLASFDREPKAPQITDAFRASWGRKT